MSQNAPSAPLEHREAIDGAIFVGQPETSLLREAIGSVAKALQVALGDRAIVDVARPLTVGSRTQLIPDLSISRDRDQPVPDVVFEMRTESTDRFALGPKRLVYARAGVPEYYFLDPQAGVLRAMLASPDQLDYLWPAVSHHRGESIGLIGFPDVRLEVTDLLPVVLERGAVHDSGV